jgi:Pentapeptide repeats (9 copies)
MVQPSIRIATERSSDGQETLRASVVPLDPDEVIEALVNGRSSLFNELRDRFPEWTPLTPRTKRSVLRGKDLSEFNLSGMNFSEFDLRDCSFENTILEDANFCHTNLARARLITYRLRGLQLTGARHLFGRSAAILPSVTRKDSAELDHEFLRELYLVVTHDSWDFLPWSILASIHKLRIFAVSYLSILILTAYAYLIKWMNAGVDGYRDWARSVSGNCEVSTLKWLCVLPEFPAYPGTGRQLLMLVFLAIAATIYLFFCPAEVKENTRSRWVFELRQNIIYFQAADHSRLFLRYVCGALYTTGGLYTAFVLWKKVWGALLYLL